MNLKRAALYALGMIIALEIITLIIGQAIYLSQIFTERQPVFFSNVSNLIFLLIIIIVTVVVTYLYLEDKKLKNKTKEGFYFGILLFVIEIIYSMLFGIYLNLKLNMQISILQGFGNFIFWRDQLAILIAATSAGFFMEKKK